MFPKNPQSEHDDLEEISWEEFFEKFDEENFAIVYQEKTDDGKQSLFCKLVDRDAKE